MEAVSSLSKLMSNYEDVVDNNIFFILKEKNESCSQVEAVSSLSKLMSNYEDVDDNNVIQE